MSKLREQLVQALLTITGVSEKKWPGRDDGFTSLSFEGKEFAHFHDDNEIDIRLTKAIISEHSLPHPVGSKVHPERSEKSPWIEMRFFNEGEVKLITRLIFKLLKH